MKVKLGVMQGRLIRALCVAGLFAIAANAALADSYAQKTAPGSLDLNTSAFDFGSVNTGPALSLPGEFHQATSNSAGGRVTLLDGVTLGFGAGADLAGRFNSYDAAGSGLYDGLFFRAAAVNSPYASLANGGTLVDATVDFTNALHFSLGEASLPQGSAFETSPGLTVARLGGIGAYDTRDARSLVAGLSWDMAPWGGIGLTASQSAERNGVLGNFDPAVRTADTSALGISARLQLGHGWTTTASFAQGVSKLDLKPGFGASSLDDLRTRSYGIAVAKHGLFGNDTMGIAVTRPAPGTGGADFDLTSGLGGRPQILPDNMLIDAQAPETDFEVGYTTSFLDGSVALQTNAAYQMNFAGQSGNNAVSFLSRAKIKF